MQAGTDFQWLQSADAQEGSHPHGAKVIHGPHPELAHFAYRHGHDYGEMGTPGAAGTYSSGMFGEMGGGDSVSIGPMHDHLEHLTVEEYERREGSRRENKEDEIQ